MLPELWRSHGVYALSPKDRRIARIADIRVPRVRSVDYTGARTPSFGNGGAVGRFASAAERSRTDRFIEDGGRGFSDIGNDAAKALCDVSSLIEHQRAGSIRYRRTDMGAKSMSRPIFIFS